MASDPLDPDHATALERFLEGVPDVEWALTGSTSFALQGVPLDPGDIDVQTDAAGARAIAEVFSEALLEPVTLVESDRMRSFLGALEIEGIEVELIGALRKRREDGTWGPPVEVSEHREFVDWRGFDVPVLSLAYEAVAYEQLGRADRAALLREFLE